MPQTSYTNDYTAALAGQLADAGDVQVDSFVAAEDIEPGRMVELNSSGKVQNPQQTTLTKPIGLALYQVTKLPGGYKAGEMVSVMRKGKAWAQITGSAPGEYVSVNINHSSTTATNRGKFTTTATSASAGVEITALEGVKFVKSGSVSGLALVELNLPA